MLVCSSMHSFFACLLAAAAVATAANLHNLVTRVEMKEGERKSEEIGAEPSQVIPT